MLVAQFLCTLCCDFLPCPGSLSWSVLWRLYVPRTLRGCTETGAEKVASISIWGVAMRAQEEALGYNEGIFIVRVYNYSESGLMDAASISMDAANLQTGRSCCLQLVVKSLSNQIPLNSVHPQRKPVFLALSWS